MFIPMHVHDAQILRRSLRMLVCRMIPPSEIRCASCVQSAARRLQMAMS
jgi:hypothetical protein